jgi:hypothetical protein
MGCWRFFSMVHAPEEGRKGLRISHPLEFAATASALPAPVKQNLFLVLYNIVQ